MIERFARSLARQQTSTPWLFVGVFLLLGVLLLPGILNLVNNVEPSLEKVLPQDIEEIETMNQMRSMFGADMMYLVITPEYPVTDVRDPRLISYMDLVADKLGTNEGILQVRTLGDEVRWYYNGTLPTTLQEIRRTPFSGQLNNADYSLAVIQIRSDTGSSAERISLVVNAIEDDLATLEQYNPGATVELTGFNAIDKATFEVIISDFQFITLISMILVMTVVILTFRSVGKAILPMIVVMNALLWTMGIAGYLGLTITVVSMVSAAMIMGLGIDFGIHVVHTYFGNREKYSSEDALEETLSELLRAMMGASLTTMAGFLALLFGVLPAMKTLSIILAMGIFTTLLGAVFLLPVLVYLYDTRLVRKG